MQWSDAIREYVDAVQEVEINAATLQKLWNLLDLTSLNNDDTESSVATFLEKAYSPYGHVAAVCIYPQFVRMARAQFDKTPVKVATVANFPKGDSSLMDVIAEISRALQMGAEEIDVVFPYERYLAGETQYAHQFVEACKAACGEDVTLKVILETSVLQDPGVIADAAYEAIAAGADFIKTSTGKLPEGATLEAACVILLVIQHATTQLKRSVGFKAAGGIREVKHAVQYLALTDRIMGAEWVDKKHFRLGASKLAEEILKFKAE